MKAFWIAQTITLTLTVLGGFLLRHPLLALVRSMFTTSCFTPSSIVGSNITGPQVCPTGDALFSVVLLGIAGLVGVATIIGLPYLLTDARKLTPIIAKP